MSGVVGPFLIASLLVAVGGAAKVVAPTSTTRALAGVGVPTRAWMVRALGVTELALGALAAPIGGRILPGLVAVAYVCFALFVVVALRAGDRVASCGCFGSATTPPSRLHVAVNLVCAGVAAVAAAADLDPLADVLADQPLVGVPFLALAALGLGLVAAVLTLLPQVLDRSPATPAVPTFAISGGPR
ncbi:MAG: hypothetical protein KDB21_11365 [Acidimicrobiales bacterium]|nr:hypothetical protein [Acidimicrobiales bacterium]